MITIPVNSYTVFLQFVRQSVDEPNQVSKFCSTKFIFEELSCKELLDHLFMFSPVHISQVKNEKKTKVTLCTARLCSFGLFRSMHLVYSSTLFVYSPRLHSLLFKSCSSLSSRVNTKRPQTHLKTLSLV